LIPGDSENTRRRVLAILGGLGVLDHAEHTAELACHFCEGHRARLVFVYPIIVPHGYDIAETVEEEILRRAGCEVIVDREPISA
jgi:hypothetical protein